MKVIICGAGRVGFGIASRLASENNDVTVVDTSSSLIRKITTDLDVKGFVGHGSDPVILKQAGVENADMIIAVTHTDEVNMIACQVAHSLFSVPKKVARVRAQNYLLDEYLELYSSDNMPIDIIISPEIEIARSILRRLKTPGAFDVVSFGNGKVTMLGVKIDDECPIIDTPIKQIPDLFPGLHAAIVGIKREGVIFSPLPDDPLSVGDDAYFITKAEHSERLLEIVGSRDNLARQIVIVGAGNIGAYLAKELEGISNVRVRLIESDAKQAELAAEELKRTVILNGDAMDSEIQEEAGVANSELVICLTNDDKTNILCAVLAKKIGAKQTISLINEISMRDLQAELGINMVVDPRATTISSILRHVRSGRILDVYSLEQGQAEIMEGEVLETSPLCGKSISDSKLVDGISIGAIVRNNKVIYPTSETVISSGDHVILLAEKTAMKEIETLFSVSSDYF